MALPVFTIKITAEYKNNKGKKEKKAKERF